ncbi:hypothetical protein ACA910_012161 [Epithemia clementina (nom. ined.)]
MNASLAAATTYSSSSMIGGSIRRWSLSQLASLEPTAATAERMLDEVATRLELQAVTCDTLRQHSKALFSSSSSSASSSSSSSNNHMVLRQLEFLHHVHVDTVHQCKQVLERRKEVWPRWSYTDQRMVRQCLEQVRDRHAPSLERWVDVAIALRNCDSRDLALQTTACELLDHVLQGRLSIQLLTHHYSLLAHEEASRRRPTGAVAVRYPLADLVHDAYTEAHFLCEAHYQCAPNLDLRVPDHLTLTVVRPWLTHILVEICKNGMCATVRQHVVLRQEQEQHLNLAKANDGASDDSGLERNDDDDDDLPPPLVVSATPATTAVPDDKNDPTEDDAIVLMVRDLGVGLPASTLSKHDNDHSSSMENYLFGWGTSSSAERWDRLKEQQSYAAVRPPLASLGVGLPTSRAMLRQFGGNLELISHNAVHHLHHHHLHHHHHHHHPQEMKENDHKNFSTTTTTTTTGEGRGCTAQITLPRNIHIPENLPPHFEQWAEHD